MAPVGQVVNRQDGCGPWPASMFKGRAAPVVIHYKERHAVRPAFLQGGHLVVPAENQNVRNGDGQRGRNGRRFGIDGEAHMPALLGERFRQCQTTHHVTAADLSRGVGAKYGCGSFSSPVH